MRKHELGGNDGDTHSLLDDSHFPEGYHIRLRDAAYIDRSNDLNGNLSREHLNKCLNGDCPQSESQLVAMTKASEYQTGQRSLRRSRWKSRTTHGARESRVQGEGRQGVQS